MFPLQLSLLCLIVICVQAGNWWDDMTSLDIKNFTQFEELLTKPNKEGKTKHYIVDFFGPNCGFCKEMKDAYNKLSLEYNDKSNEDFIFASVNGGDKSSVAIANKYGFHAYPTVVYYRPGTLKVKSMYDGFPRTYQSIKEWALLT